MDGRRGTRYAGSRGIGSALGGDLIGSGIMKKTIQLAELSESVRTFFDQIDPRDELVVEDGPGQRRYTVLSSSDPTEARRARAREELAEIQRRVGESMRRQGLTEEDLDRAIQADD
jgi:hypothetical protein